MKVYGIDDKIINKIIYVIAKRIKMCNTVYYSSCHICEKQIWIEYITALTILIFKTSYYMRHFEEESV